MAIATQEAIRDRLYTLVESRSPTSLTTKFLRFRNEDSADFDDWAEKNPAAAFRRFQIREAGDDELPDVSNPDLEAVIIQFNIRIAYPQSHRYGAANAMDRDDVMNQDWKLLNAALGIYGRANFSSTNDCTPLGAVKTREQGGKVDFLVVTARFRYFRAVV